MSTLVPDGHDFWSADWRLVPAHLQSALTAYITTGRPPGGGLRSILEDRPMSYCLARLDDEVRPRAFDVSRFLFNFAPSQCWGSADKVDAWIEAGRTRVLALGR